MVVGGLPIASEMRQLVIERERSDVQVIKSRLKLVFMLIFVVDIVRPSSHTHTRSSGESDNGSGV